MTETRKKLMVKFEESVATLADPRPTEELDRKYLEIRRKLLTRESPPSETTIVAQIEVHKKLDRYGEKAWGFTRDRSFRPGQETTIDAELARAWEAAGYCVIVGESLAA